MPRKVDRTGEIATNNQGKRMTIVEYNNCHDMVVEFEDGARINGVYYSAFVQGRVRHPADRFKNDDTSCSTANTYSAVKVNPSKKTERVGEKAINSKGWEMTIEVYHNSHDMVIKFEDGTLVSGVDYVAFKKGYVRHPKGEKPKADTNLNAATDTDD